MTTNFNPPDYDVLIVGGGAAGMATAIFLLQHGVPQGLRLRVGILESAAKPGAKILVSGGGRCNVTHREVTPEDYQGGNRHILRNILRTFSVPQTLEWFASLGVELKLEPTGKWFPVSDKARTVLSALLDRLAQLGAEWLNPLRAQNLEPIPSGGWQITCSDGKTRSCHRLVVATGGMALPKSGSDGWGLSEMRRLGHRIVPPVPSLAPLLAGEGTSSSGFPDLSGLSANLTLRLDLGKGQNSPVVTGSTLFTHFGLSGPAPMNISRHVSQAQATRGLGPMTLYMGLPELASEQAADRWLQDRIREIPTRLVHSLLQDHLPERLAGWWVGDLGGLRLGSLNRGQRMKLSRSLVLRPVTVGGTRGFTFAETTAGGVDLSEINHRTMASRIVPDLYLVGEILDVDGRIGGFNFQWAWATGYIAGRAITSNLSQRTQASETQ